MQQLNRSMMERYEIPNRRPETLRAVLFGTDAGMLETVARLLDCANERGADIGALCVSAKADALRRQDGMFTLLVRGEAADGSPIHEERVVQAIVDAVDPEAEFERFVALAAAPEIEMIFVPAEQKALEIALEARFLYARASAGFAAPRVICVDAHASPNGAQALKDAIARTARRWDAEDTFTAWLANAQFQTMLAESLGGRLSAAERARAEAEMNYGDAFLSWTEPELLCTMEKDAPEALRALCTGADFAQACAKKARVFDALAFLCASVGWLCGMDSFAGVLGDEALRAWIGHAFFDELLPELPWSRAQITPCVISAFGRLENRMNAAPLLEIAAGMMGRFDQTLLPAIRRRAEREFEAPPRLSLAFGAAIMLYAGARMGTDGCEVLRGKERHCLRDDEEILAAFARLSHDMPAETLAYAVLADRALWGCDLREIDGLEMRVAFELSSIQRVGLRETMKLQENI